MQRDVQCCMLYSQGKVRTKDVLRFEVQTEGPDCSIQAIMQVFQISHSRSCGGAWRPAGSENITSCLVEGGGRRPIVIFPGHVVVMAGPEAVTAKEVRKEICRNNEPSAKKNTFHDRSHSVGTAGPVKRNQFTLWEPVVSSRSPNAAAAQRIKKVFFFVVVIAHLAKSSSAANALLLQVPFCVSEFQRDEKINPRLHNVPFFSL